MLRTEDKVLKNSEAGRTGEKAHKKMLRSQMAAPLTVQYPTHGRDIQLKRRALNWDLTLLKSLSLSRSRC